MRIGIDARLWNETGVGRYIRNLVWQLQIFDSTNEYVLFVPPGFKNQELLARSRYAQSSLGGEIKGDKFRLVETNIRWHTLEEQLQFPKILEKERLDLVHFPYFSVPIFYRRPFIVTIHDLIIHHFPTGEASTHHPLVYHGKRLGYEYIMKKAAQKSKKIITVSNATKHEIMDHLHIQDEKIIVTYEGVDEAIIRGKNLPAGGRVQEKRIKNSNYFLYVGNAYPHKNLDRLLLALKEVITKHKNTKLVLVGKKDFFYQRIQKRIEELQLKENVQIFHDVSDEELQLLYRSALAVVLPSKMEGFGLPAVETMANLQKLILSDIPVFHEVCADAGIYFDPNSTEDLQNKLLHAIDYSQDPMYLDKIKAGQKRLEMFSWEKMAKDTLAVYEATF
jgi:glycosyltransferase involved in cell wall biosynthesis